MKNKNTSKVQILAILALALSLGLVAPSAAVFAEGDEAGAETETQAGTGEGTNADDTKKEETKALDESIVELNSRIKTRDTFEEYNKVAAKLIPNMQTLAGFTEDAEAAMSEVASSTEGKSLWEVLSSDTKTALAKKDYYAGLQYIKTQNGTEYTNNKAKIEELLTAANAAIANIRSEMSTIVPSVALETDLTPAQLISDVKDEVEHYAVYEALYNALAFVRKATPTSGVVTAANINEEYTPEEQIVGYNQIAVAALKIDGSVMSGLYSYKLPTAGGEEDKKPEAPDSGIVGLFESGALDMSTITLIVSVAVASVAGLGLIAKLYLKHKF